MSSRKEGKKGAGEWCLKGKRGRGIPKKKLKGWGSFLGGTGVKGAPQHRVVPGGGGGPVDPRHLFDW